MPLLRISYPQGALDREQKSKVAEVLTDLIMEAEVGEATDAGRSITVVQFDETARDRWAVGGRLIDEQAGAPAYIIVSVIVAEGFLDKMRRDVIHARTQQAFERACPGGVSLPGRVWCLITEIPHGGWGAAGGAISASDIARVVGLDPHSARSREIAAQVGALDAREAAASPPLAAE